MDETSGLQLKRKYQRTHRWPRSVVRPSHHRLETVREIADLFRLGTLPGERRPHPVEQAALQNRSDADGNRRRADFRSPFAGRRHKWRRGRASLRLERTKPGLPAGIALRAGIL